MKRIVITFIAGALSFSAATAAELSGEWLNADGQSKVRFANCGSGVCGAISWLKNPAHGTAKVGQQVFYGLKPQGAGIWKGSAFNPEDGKTYAGKVTLSGARLTTAGCGLGGLVCKSQDWSRAR